MTKEEEQQQQQQESRSLGVCGAWTSPKWTAPSGQTGESQSLHFEVFGTNEQEKTLFLSLILILTPIVVECVDQTLTSVVLCGSCGPGLR